MRYPKEFVIGMGILVIILGIAALFKPTLARYIRLPGNERTKALSAIISGFLTSVIVYYYL